MFDRITIRTNILTNILVVVAIVAGSLLGLQYHFSKKMALEATKRDFSDAAEKITLHLKDRDRLARSVLYELAYDRSFIRLSTPFPHETIRRFAYTMEHHPRIYAINLGNPYGDLFEVINMKERPELFKIYRAPPRTRWIAVHIHETSKGRFRRYDFLDADLKRVFSRSEPTDFDVTTRPWYLEAIRNDGVFRTLPYLFGNLKKRGITYSKTIGHTHTVVAIDLILTELNDLLKNQIFAPRAQICMFDRNGTVIASTNGNPVAEKPMVDMAKAAKLNEVARKNLNGSDRFMMVTELSKEAGEGTYLGFSVPVDSMLAPYLHKIYYAVVVMLGVLFLSIPLIFFTASRIVRPIKALMRENEKIKGRHYDDVRPVETNIVELIELSDSLVAMSRSIQAYEKSLKEMMESFIKLIADAIDAKSPYTGGHCKRVPVIARMLAKAANDAEEGEFKAFRFEGGEEMKAFELGAWLHDCGKITTPEFVVDKATKLETIYNRIHEIRTRFEVIWRDIEIGYYERLLQGEEKERLKRWKEEEHRKLLEDFRFIARCNLGGEFMGEEDKKRIETIAERKWVRHFDDRLGLSDAELQRYENVEKREPPAEEPLLADRPEHIAERVGFDEESYREKGFKLEVPEHLYNFGEIYNLCIEKGTLSEEERFKIEEHVMMTIRMLEQLPYPPGMEKIPEYAGTHHETMDGTGYPRKLTKEKLSIPARIMAIADIFEALTASDRPYKKMKTLSESLQIMVYMVKEGHLDAELFALFLKSGIYRTYAEKYLRPEQIDEVDVDRLLKESTNS